MISALQKNPQSQSDATYGTAVPKTALDVFDVGIAKLRIRQKPSADLVTLSEAGVE